MLVVEQPCNKKIKPLVFSEARQIPLCSMNGICFDCNNVKDACVAGHVQRFEHKKIGTLCSCCRCEKSPKMSTVTSHDKKYFNIRFHHKNLKISLLPGILRMQRRAK